LILPGDVYLIDGDDCAMRHSAAAVQVKHGFDGGGHFNGAVRIDVDSVFAGLQAGRGALILDVFGDSVGVNLAVRKAYRKQPHCHSPNMNMGPHASFYGLAGGASMFSFEQP